MEQGKDPRAVSAPDEIDLKSLFLQLYRHARLIIGITIVSALVAIPISFLLPVYYKAETRLLPPQERGGSLAAQLLGQAGGLIGLASGVTNFKSQGELFVEMLKSRTVLDRIVDRFDLMKLYEKRYRQDARKALLESVTAREDRKSGIIVLTVEERNPKRAADMANAFVEELKSLAGGLAISEAGQRRMFFEEQLRHTKESLGRAEEDFKVFAQRTGMFQIDAQARAIIEGIARLRAGIVAKEVEAEVIRSFATPQNPDLQTVEEEIRALRSELEKAESGKGRGFDPIMSSGRVPEVGTEYLRKLRQLKYYETLYELLAKQFELAKLEEARNAVVIQVIDRAVPPERKSRPKKAVFVVLFTGAGFLLAALYVLFVDWYTANSENPKGDTSPPPGNVTG